MNHENSEPGKGGLSVRIDNNNVEKGIKILKKKVMTDGLLKDLKRRSAYEKPGDRKRREKAEARRRYLKMQAQFKELDI